MQPDQQSVPDQPSTGGLTCVACGYDLRGTPANGLCPECGTPVQRSVLRDPLYLADIGWLRGIRRGLALVYGVSLFWVVTATFGVSLYVAVIFTSWNGMPPLALQVVSIVASLSFWLIVPLGAIAVWRSTRPEPHPAMLEPTLSRRRIALVLALFAAVLFLIEIARFAGQLSGTYSLLLAIPVRPQMLLLISFALLLHRLGELVVRTPRGMAVGEKLKQWGILLTNLAAVNLIVQVSLSLLITHVLVPGMAPGATSGYWIVAIGSQLLHLAVWVVSIIYVVKLRRGRQFVNQLVDQRLASPTEAVE